MSSWYSWGYHAQTRSVRIWSPLFLASMVAVVLSQNVWVFMTAWESMTMTSFFLVVTHHSRPQVLQSGYIYLLMSKLSATCLLIGFLVMGSSLHSMNFSVWQVSAVHLTPCVKNWIMVFLGVGFGIKSGIVPFHIWLPRAHPAAPAPVSSLMSGAMIKLGIFGILQFLLIDLGPTSRVWALGILTIGALSSLLGVLYALMEHDLKRLLAYHSIENIGIILLGAGVMSVGIDGHQPVLISLGMAASLFHTLNHAVFKSQLFLVAGAVEQHAGTLDADHLGGLIRTIPSVAFGFLMGSMAISALPPFNGFISEWLTFRGLLAMAFHGGVILSVWGLALAMILGLTGALAGMCFVKASGVIFLGQPRRRVPAFPVPLSMTGPIIGLAGLALLFGLVPEPLIHLIAGVYPRGSLSGPPLVTPVRPLIVGGVVILAIVLLSIFGRVWEIREVPRWASGRIANPSMQISSASFTKAIRTTFAVIYRPHRHLSRTGPFPADFPQELHYQGGTKPVWERYLYRPLYRLLWAISRQSTRIQAGPIRLYLAYLLGAAGIMLLMVH